MQYAHICQDWTRVEQSVWDIQPSANEYDEFRVWNPVCFIEDFEVIVNEWTIEEEDIEHQDILC